LNSLLHMTLKSRKISLLILVFYKHVGASNLDLI
jgi:hypothetical protein